MLCTSDFGLCARVTDGWSGDRERCRHNCHQELRRQHHNFARKGERAPASRVAALSHALDLINSGMLPLLLPLMAATAGAGGSEGEAESGSNQL
jgi:hypothetical protein